jgi:hypothetical protein
MPSCRTPACGSSQAKGDLDGKKVRLARLRGTPGLAEGKVVEAEREVTDSEDKVRARCKVWTRSCESAGLTEAVPRRSGPFHQAGVRHDCLSHD